ncbi:MAG: hypothetical protein OXH07_11635 [Chloroflexi bacterium]|nr:hypothetical protein [Chloroflexota bacterium]
MSRFTITVVGDDGAKKLEAAGFTRKQAELVQELIDRSVVSIVDGLNAHLDVMHPAKDNDDEEGGVSGNVESA